MDSGAGRRGWQPAHELNPDNVITGAKMPSGSEEDVEPTGYEDEG